MDLFFFFCFWGKWEHKMYIFCSFRSEVYDFVIVLQMRANPRKGGLFSAISVFRKANVWNSTKRSYFHNTLLVFQTEPVKLQWQELKRSHLRRYEDCTCPTRPDTHCFLLHYFYMHVFLSCTISCEDSPIREREYSCCVFML